MNLLGTVSTTGHFGLILGLKNGMVGGGGEREGERAGWAGKEGGKRIPNIRPRMTDTIEANLKTYLFRQAF